MSSTSWWTRLAYTPLSDAVRGDLTASLDWQAKLHKSGAQGGLPGEGECEGACCL